MFRPQVTPHQLVHQHQPLNDDIFGVMSWNTQKQTLSPAFEQCLRQLLVQFPTRLLLLQEAKIPLKQRLPLEGWSYAVAPNMQTASYLFGVLTAGQCAFDDIRAVLSQGRELKFATHKSQVITHHPLPGGDTLLVTNIHAINFVHHGQFDKEIAILRQILLQHKGPLIVAGDFNVWSRSRRMYLAQFCRAMGLKKAVMEDEHHIKSYRKQTLDYIFYRELKLQSATAIDTRTVSDHNPIYAQFSR